MQRIRYFYLIELQYLGFRYHGWQKQPKIKTVERMVQRTIKYVLGEKRFKLLATGRTDAMVSASQTFVELFVEKEALDMEEFFFLLNKNLPPDVRALSIKETDEKFNIIQHSSIKEYLYFFSFGEKFHPFCAPFMVNIQGYLDIKEMKKAAKLFEGKHDFRSYTYRPKPQTQTKGEILCCEIIENDLYTANFFPEKSYMMRVKSPGFKRHQIRLMMGVLFDLGKEEINLDFVRQTLQPENDIILTHIAQASGLIINSVEYKKAGN